MGKCSQNGKRGDSWRNHFLDEQTASEIQAQLSHQIPLLNNRPSQNWLRYGGVGGVG